MKRIIILGCGFSGLSAAGYFAGFARRNKTIEILAIDKSKYFNFLPMLPDCLGRGVNPEFLTYDIEHFAKARNFKFLNAQVSAIDLEKKEVSVSGQLLSYDYLLISSGTETNFYGNDALAKAAYKLDSSDDAKKIRQALNDDSLDTYVVAGGGYTGIEVATNLSLYAKKKSLKKRVFVVERAPAILGPLPGWMRDYVQKNLKELKIEVFTDTAIKEAKGREILLTSGIRFTNALLIWTAGVKTALYLQNLALKKNPQGRIEADEYLRLNDNCFVAGDSALFKYQDNFLRMSVQFAITQGRCAALNIIRSILGKTLLAYRPQDPGYIIPLANNRACGKILGKDMRGCLPIMLHYLMCIYRARGLGNKLGIIRDLIKAG
jgi:NADH dehydrogenase